MPPTAATLVSTITVADTAILATILAAILAALTTAFAALTTATFAAMADVAYMAGPETVARRSLLSASGQTGTSTGAWCCVRARGVGERDTIMSARGVPGRATPHTAREGHADGRRAAPRRTAPARIRSGRGGWA